MNFIIHKPIISALIFIALFELFFQYQYTTLTYIICVYILLKAFGLTDIIKRYSRKIINRLFNKHLDSLKKNLLDIEIMFKDENGVLEARYYFQKDRQDYLASVTKTSENMVIWLFGDNMEISPLKFESKPFYVTKANIIKYLETVHFDKPVVWQ
jgi:hypothetical protein